MFTMSKKISESLRNAVWLRYIGKEKGMHDCFCCNLQPIDRGNYECGHIISRKNGGETTLQNLRPICGKCNKSMGIEHMEDFMKQNGFEKPIEWDGVKSSEPTIALPKLIQSDTSNDKFAQPIQQPTEIPLCEFVITNKIGQTFLCGKNAKTRDQNDKWYCGSDSSGHFKTITENNPLIYECDCCAMPITTDRYNCGMCEFDLCQKCYDAGLHPADHLKIHFRIGVPHVMVKYNRSDDILLWKIMINTTLTNLRMLCKHQNRIRVVSNYRINKACLRELHTIINKMGISEQAIRIFTPNKFERN